MHLHWQLSTGYPINTKCCAVYDTSLTTMYRTLLTCSGSNKNNVVSVDSRLVLRLTDNIDGLHKGCVVLAMFPDTTSFYR
jgi:hypothetical protein